MVDIQHSFTSAKGDGPDNTRVQPSNWNSSHNFTLSQTDVVVGRSSAGAGVAEEIICTAYGRTLLAYTAQSDLETDLGFQADLDALETALRSSLSAPTGTRMLFQQTTAPTGWTKEVNAAFNDRALRIVTGTVGSGGSSPFTTVFGKTATDSHALTVSEIPSHAHDIRMRTSDGDSTTFVRSGHATNGNLLTGSTQTEGGGGSHTHSMDMRVQYNDVIIATKAA